jgi:SAM-dependent methyltransferase
MTIYSQSFYQRHQDGMRRSARAVVPIVCDLLHPKSVIDVGCGVGTWLSVFRQAGVEDVFGIDGEWVNKAQLEIPVEKFLAVDLTNPVVINRQFDLVVSLEVAEHLPQERAESFVDFLTYLGPAILFSAAIPHQGGSNHVNEQWPEYWIQYFQARNYCAIDALRKKVWLDENVEWWYAQNTFIFARADHIALYPSLQTELQRTSVPQFSLVHPKAYLEAVEWNHKLHLMARDISALLTPDDAFIFVDDGQFRQLMAAGRRVWPFLERNGEYWGAPADDGTAIRELERLRALGARFIVFAWSTFWWLGHYQEFHNYLRSKFRCTAENDHIVAFDLSLPSR